MTDLLFLNDNEEKSSLYINVLIFSIVVWIIFAFYMIIKDLIVPILPNSVWDNILKSNILEYFFINVPLLHFIL